MARPVAAALAAGCITAFALAASAFAATPDEMNAPPVPWADAGATPIVQLDAKKQPTMIALAIPGALVNSLPKKRSEAVYPMKDAGLVQTANLQWHPVGHEPDKVYDVPHFDVHFYTITEPVRQTIVPGAAAGSVMPAKEILPPDSMLAPGFVPGMGMHNIAKAAPEFNGSKFTISPIIGYWNGDLAFFEVMFTKDWLQLKRGMVGTFPQPASVKQHGAYPTKYSVQYDKVKDVYQIALTDFIQR
jgi:hypothetical protein